ncbi:MAG TPA: MAPEG family protein [Steroidobacteraceae bacterium]|nr:MAPEG family protein [Steroidobacteraceae bacterium]
MLVSRGWGFSLLVLVSVLALLQSFLFATLVSRARSRYGVAAPAVSGHEIFERYFRVQMNTLELLVLFIPALWLGSLYVAPIWPVLLGVLYLLGRLLYLRSYVADPRKRGPGFGLSVLPILVLLLIALVGCIRQLILFH